MRSKSLAGLALALALPAAAAALPNITHVMINKDLVNQGPAAYDLAIVLAGTQGINSTFDGYASGPIQGYFDPPTVTTVGGNTVVHWQNFFDNTDTKIDNNQKIHVGIDVPAGDANRQILDMYWTDLHGHRISGSVVYNVTDNVTYTTSTGHLSWTFTNAQAIAVSLTNIRYAVLSTSVPLDQLSQQNTELAAALRPLSDGVVVSAGGSQSIDLPGAIAPGSAVVVVYDETAKGSSALVTNYAEAAITEQ